VATNPPAAWADALADAIRSWFDGPVPAGALERARLQLLDSLACAAGAVEAEPVRAVRRALAPAGAPESTVLFGRERIAALDAILVNGAAVRYLDANDVYLDAEGPGGHPSDNIVAALAVAERSGCSGRDLLVAIAVAYELTWRLRRDLLRPLPRGADWDAVTLSSIVCAAVGALLLGADRRTLAEALSIAAVRGFTLREIRGGEISALKALGNALVAREGVLAALLATAGMSGPRLAFEGRRGLVRTLGGEPTPALLDALRVDPVWAIDRISVKAFPALGTAQAALHAAVRLHPVAAEEIAAVEIRLPDARWTRTHGTIAERHLPTSRESADHSISYLVAMALLTGRVDLADYERRAWLDPAVRRVIEATTIVPDAALNARATASFPAVVTVTRTDGTAATAELVAPPGSPGDPYDEERIAAKFARLDRTGTDRAAVVAAVRALPDAPDVTALMATLTPTAVAAR